MTLNEELKEDFEGFRRVAGEHCYLLFAICYLLFVSFAAGKQTIRSDIGICIVTPSEGILDDIYDKVGGNRT